MPGPPAHIMSQEEFAALLLRTFARVVAVPEDPSHLNFSVMNRRSFEALEAEIRRVNAEVENRTEQALGIPPGQPAASSQNLLAATSSQSLPTAASSPPVAASSPPVAASSQNPPAAASSQNPQAAASSQNPPAAATNSHSVVTPQTLSGARRVRTRWMEPLPPSPPPPPPPPPPGYPPGFGSIFERSLPQLGHAVNCTCGRHTDEWNSSCVLDDWTNSTIRAGSRAERYHHGQGIARRLPPHRFGLDYRCPREIPLTSNDACRCQHYLFEQNPARFEARTGGVRDYTSEIRFRNRLRALGEVGAFSTIPSYQLVEIRQVRSMVGLSTEDYDEEITRRVLCDPQAFGRLGTFVRRQGWVEEAIMDAENYMLH